MAQAADALLARKAKRPQCGARCRDSHACQATVVKVRARCRMHGGHCLGPTTLPGKTRALKSHTIERLVNRLKQFRRVATRDEKLAANHLAVLTLAAITLWI